MSATTTHEAETVSNELYTGISPEVRLELEKRERTRKTRPGETLLQYGVMPEQLVLLKSGKVEISVNSSAHDVVLGTIGPGKAFGMRAAMTGEPAEITVTCIGECEIDEIPIAEFQAVLQSNPQLYFVVAKVLSADLKIVDELLRSCSRRVVSAARKNLREV
ncbi:MAG TPA: cyclic nucleotide-binding domain-containing protein [Candidatus Limnocylindrales bacterium]|jgi:CRP-like cAMP-binding protein|nr:cyclic nucleotide-binding domain-containing protein [Candidatus Limnocylindrales bacterium]